jgi:hypothetical protein
MVEEMKKYREEMNDMLQDLKDKQDRAQVLADEMSKLPKNINRSVSNGEGNFCGNKWRPKVCRALSIGVNYLLV